MSGSPASDEPSCQRCRFWQRLQANPTQGECRRYAPRPEAFESIHMMATWPISNRDDWCGEYEEPPGPGA